MQKRTKMGELKYHTRRQVQDMWESGNYRFSYRKNGGQKEVTDYNDILYVLNAGINVAVWMGDVRVGRIALSRKLAEAVDAPAEKPRENPTPLSLSLSWVKLMPSLIAVLECGTSEAKDPIKRHLMELAKAVDQMGGK